MKTLSLSLLTAWLLAGCAAYKQLEPNPQLSSNEGGYFEIKRGEKDFELKEGKKYFIAFPPPAEKNYYLVLESTRKPVIEAFLTGAFVGQKPGSKIRDESYNPALQYAYPVDNGSPMYYWLIEGVRSEVPLAIKYRYVPQWRFKFENKYAGFQRTLKDHRVDRKFYVELGLSFHFPSSFDFSSSIDTTARDSSELQAMLRELLAIQSIFPASILNSADPAYQNYVALKKSVEEELGFQEDYLRVLGFFKEEMACRGNPLGFLDGVSGYLAYFDRKERLTPNALKESQVTIDKRLKELVPFYDGLFARKTDASPLDSTVFRLSPYYRLPDLYKTSGLPVAADFSLLDEFLRAFDARSRSLAGVQAAMQGAAKSMKENSKMPEDGFFGGLGMKVEQAARNLPPALEESHGKYLSNICAIKFKEDLDKARKDAAAQNGQYLEAESVVRQVNALRKEKDYSGMLGILKDKAHLAFLTDKYRPLDGMFVEGQAGVVREALGGSQFSSAEAGLLKLFKEKNFIDPAKIAPLKNKVVDQLEDSLYLLVDRFSRSRVNKFCEEKVHQLSNVDSLYTDSVFFPAHDITFSSGGRSELAVRKAALISDLAKLKENEFPAKAIKLLFDQFMQNPDDSGVYRARAVVAHGRHYTAKDKEVEARVAECDPLRPKWIVKPTEYRRVFAFPVTDKPGGKNRYVVKLNVRIPTEAKFPVYDVNVKLPKEVAQNASDSIWYEKISLNDKLLKNEGRFSITAPTPANNYECQITPVQMDKDGNNVLTLQFQHKSFKSLPISVMVQKPLIKKN